MKLCNLFLLFLFIVCCGSKKVGISKEYPLLLLGQDINFDTLLGDSAYMIDSVDIPLLKFHDFEIEKEYSRFNKDSLILVSSDMFLYFPFGEFDTIEEFLKEYPGWTLDMEKKRFSVTHYFLSNGTNRVILMSGANHYSEKLEVVSVSLVEESAILKNNIRVGVPKRDIFNCFMDISQIDNLDDIHVLELESALYGICWMFYNFNEDILTSIIIKTEYGINVDYMLDIFSLGLDYIDTDKLNVIDEIVEEEVIETDAFFSDFNILEKYTRFNNDVLYAVTTHPFLFYPFGKFSSIDKFLTNYPYWEVKGAFLEEDYYAYALTYGKSKFYLSSSENAFLRLDDISIRDENIVLINDIHVGISKKDLISHFMDTNKLGNLEDIRVFQIEAAFDGTWMDFYFEDDILMSIRISSPSKLSLEMSERLLKLAE